MKAITSLFTIGLLSIALLPLAAAEPNADQLLQQMSAKLASAQGFSFTATRNIAPALLAGHNEPENARIVVTVHRPNKIVAHSTSKDGLRHFYADGQNVSLVDGQKNLYSTVPMHKSIDGVIAELDRKYGFTPPLAEIALSDVYQDIHEKAQGVSYLGQGTIGGVTCHRLALAGKVADAELWVGVDDQLPRRLISTVKELPGKPQLKVEFIDWNLAAKVTDKDFAFAPPQGAQKISMITTAETAAAQKTNKVTQN